MVDTTDERDTRSGILCCHPGWRCSHWLYGAVPCVPAQNIMANDTGSLPSFLHSSKDQHAADQSGGHEPGAIDTDLLRQFLAHVPMACRKQNVFAILGTGALEEWQPSYLRVERPQR